MPISEEETFTLVFLSVVLLVGSILVEYPVQWSTVHFGSYLKTSLVPLVALSLSWTHPDWFGSLSGPAQAGVGGMGVLATLGIWKSEQRKLEREQEEGPAKIELALEAQRGEKKARWGDWTFSIEEGFFVHDNTPDGLVPAAVMPRLGLIDDSPSRWADFKDKIARLNKDAPVGTAYKLAFVQRHGEGWHNVAEAFYGSPRWNSEMARLYSGDGMIWGPDPELTARGIEQARDVALEWSKEVSEGGAQVVLPEVLWSSPLWRAAVTMAVSYENVLLLSPSAPSPVIKESLREVIGRHTCDFRSPAWQIETVLGRVRNPSNPLNFVLERGFTLFDELWTPNNRETDESMVERAHLILSELFATESAQHVALAGHGGIIRALFWTTAHKACATPTGALIPMVIKGVRSSQ